jgi:hypothetical protein
MLNKWLIAGFGFLGLPAEAQTNKFDEFGIPLPPARYILTAPAGPVALHFVPQSEFDVVCAEYAAMSTDPLVACAVLETDNSCKVYFKDNELIGTDSFHAVLVHEMAHCSGWHVTHPD